MSQELGNLSLGAKVKFGKFQVNSETPEEIIWMVVAKNHSCTPAYPENAITLHVPEIIDLRCFDASEQDNDSDWYRKSFGNNRYSVSNIDQWLNKDAASDSWYSPAHSADHSPDTYYNTGNCNTQYAARPGFLNAFSDDEKDAILLTTIRVVRTDLDGGSYEDISRKVFLPSVTEVGFADENNIAEGKSWQGSTGYKYVTQQCFDNTLSSTKPSSRNIPWCYWLRTPNTSRTDEVRVFASDSSLGSKVAFGGTVGIRPALNLPSSLNVSDSTDSDGCYTFIWNQAPTKPSYINVPTSIYSGESATIDWGASTDPDGNLFGYILQRKVDSGDWEQIYKGENLTYTDSITYGWRSVQYRVCAYDSKDETSDYQESTSQNVTYQPPVISGSDAGLGVKTEGFTQTYTVTDLYGDSVTVKESIDNNIIRSYEVTLGAENTFSVSGETWLELVNGSHTMKIKATGSFEENTDTRTYTFTKSASGFTIQNATPYFSSALPTRIRISVARNIPAESDFKVYVCNNGFDSSPNWEDATSSVTGGLIHVFENTTKTSTDWGVIIKVIVARGEGEGNCYVTQITGNFE